MGDPLQELDRREWRLLKIVVAVGVGLVGFIVLLESDALPPSLRKPVALSGGLALLVLLAVLRVKALRMQSERGRIDPMSLGERAVAALIGFAALLGLALTSAFVQDRGAQTAAFAGLALAVVAACGLLYLRHRRHRRRRSG